MLNDKMMKTKTVKSDQTVDAINQFKKNLLKKWQKDAGLVYQQYHNIIRKEEEFNY